MARSPLLGRLQLAAAITADAATREAHYDRVQAERRIGRRDALKLGAVVGLAAGAAALGTRPSAAANAGSVVC
jgi:hypothetical protein